MKGIFFSFLFLFSFSTTNAVEQVPIDSLLHVLRQEITDKERAHIYNRLAEEYSFSDPVLGLKYADSALILSRESEDRINEVDALNHKGWILMEKGQYGEALETYTLASEVASEYKLLKGLAGAYNGLGVVYWYQGLYDESIRAYDKCLDIYEELEEISGIGYAYNNKGLVYEERGYYERALSSYQQAIRYFEQDNNSNGLADAATNIGAIYMAQDNFVQALVSYRKVLPIYLQLNYTVSVADTYHNIGQAHQALGNLDSALLYYAQSERLFRELESNGGLIAMNKAIGTIYSLKGDHETGLGYFLKAAKLIKAEPNAKAEADLCILLGQSYAATGQPVLAEANLLKAKELSEQMGYADFKQRAAYALGMFYKQQGNYKKAFENYVEATEIKDSLINQEQTRKLALMEAQYIFQKEKDSIQYANEAEKMALNKTIETQRTIKVAVSGGLAISLIFLFVLYRYYQLKRKSNERLTELNEEIRSINEEILTQNEDIKDQNEKIEKINHDLTDNITYAKRIQTAIFPFPERVKKTFKEYFVTFLPRDIVSGDFYWMHDFGDYVILAVADCTGHGVSGAFMSLIGYDRLNEVIFNFGERGSANILNCLNERVDYALNQNEGNHSDGMDISLVTIDKRNFTLEYAGAKLPLLVVNQGSCQLFKGDPISIGGNQKNKDYKFHSEKTNFNSDTTIYLFTDGFPTQLGGVDDSKYQTRRLVEFLHKHSTFPMVKQQIILEEEIKEWMAQGKEEQLDDITVTGFRLKFN